MQRLVILYPILLLVVICVPLILLDRIPHRLRSRRHVNCPRDGKRLWVKVLFRQRGRNLEPLRVLECPRLRQEGAEKCSEGCLQQVASHHETAKPHLRPRAT